jgi:hypothetical protein
VKEQIGNWQKFLERLWHAACRPSWAVDTSQLEFSEGTMYQDHEFTYGTGRQKLPHIAPKTMVMTWFGHGRSSAPVIKKKFSSKKA